MSKGRKLVTIRRVDDVVKHHNADRLDVCIIGGWRCIVKKNTFKKGDLGVYFEIDSFLPNEEQYSFLGKPKKYLKHTGYRIRTMKLRGEVSQGLLLPFSSIKSGVLPIDTQEGDDVTKYLGVIKYDTAKLYNNNNKQQSCTSTVGTFPQFLQKTDQERIQNLPHYFEKYKNCMWQETLKLDGSSMTVFKINKPLTIWKIISMLIPSIFSSPYETGVCSRNVLLKRTNKQDNFFKAVDKYNLLNDLPVGFAIQGELLAPNIQGNHEQISEVEYYIFDVWDIANQTYLQPDEAVKFVSTHLPKAKYVPIINSKVDIFSVCDSYDKLQDRVTGDSMNKGVVSEGRVYKLLDATNKRVTFKCISNKYLLNEK